MVKVKCRKITIQAITPTGSGWMDSAICTPCPNRDYCKDGILELELTKESVLDIHYKTSEKITEARKFEIKRQRAEFARSLISIREIYLRIGNQTFDDAIDSLIAKYSKE